MQPSSGASASCVWCYELALCVRPLVTLAFAALIIYMALKGQLSPDFIQGVCLGCINYWYAERAALSSSDVSR
jgi:hypothetical protein